MTVCVEIREATDVDITNLKARFLTEPDKSIGFVTVGSGALGEIVLVIRFDNEIAGFITFRTLNSEVFPIFVFSHYRRKGIAAEAMRQFIAKWKAEGGEEIFLDIKEGAEAFWGKVFAGYSVRHIIDRKFSVDISQR